MASILPLYADHVAASVTSVVEAEPLASSTATASGAVYGTVRLTARPKAGPVSSLFGSYLKRLERKPLQTKMTTVGAVYGASDLFAQFLGGASLTHLDMHRTLAMIIIGVLLTAPLYHFLYNALERKVPTTERKYNALIHLAVDQLVAVPFWSLCYFPAMVLLLGPRSWSTVIERVQSDYLSLLFTTWTVYPVIQFVNFSYVPAHMRVIVMTGVSFFFTAVISFLFAGGSASVNHMAHLIVFPPFR